MLYRCYIYGYLFNHITHKTHPQDGLPRPIMRRGRQGFALKARGDVSQKPWDFMDISREYVGYGGIV